MFRSPHFYGYGLIFVAALTIGCGWWNDHAQLSQRVTTLDADAQKLADDLSRNQADQAKRIAMSNEKIDYLVGELKKSGVRIERMAAGGFRRVYGNVPTNPSDYAGQTTIINGPEDVARLPKDRQPLYIPR